MLKDIMDVKEVAEYLYFSEKKIRNMIKTRSIPYSKIGGQYRFLKTEIDNWLTEKTELPLKNTFKETLEQVKAISSSLEKRLLFMGLLTGELAVYKLKPVVVGGNALEFYTLGGYATGDIDIVFPDNDILGRILVDWGFEKEGRHWFNLNLDIAIEAPARTLAGDFSKISEVKIKNFIVYIIGIEDLIVDRLNACVHWKSEDDGFWAKELILIHQDKIDWDYLLKSAKNNGVEKALLGIKAGIGMKTSIKSKVKGKRRKK